MPRIQARSNTSRVMDKYSTGEEDSSDSPAAQDCEWLGSSVLQHYVDACAQLDDTFEKDTVFQTGMSRVKEHLARASSAMDCLICLGRIKPQEAVWSCTGGCFAVLHLVCIQDWVKNQQEAAGLRASSRLSPELFPQAAAGAAAASMWHCPKCRHPYDAKQVPSQYTCFCGKASNPEWDPWLTPHSCGEMCGKKLPGSCHHTCTLLCHPGPCPPCPRVVDAPCFCGKKIVRRRCGNFEFSCARSCGHKLECGHMCEEVCHSGVCPPCLREGQFSCACGAEMQTLSCGRRGFHCDRVCGKALSCGRHTCKQVCHGGTCKGCPNEGIRKCPCGKKTHNNLHCDEKVPTCVETCGKLLSCGSHRCQEKCHYGPCTKICRAMVAKACRCGGTAKQVQCHAEVTCEYRCMSKRNCGRHPCKRRCCDGNCPPCEELCGRRLRCGHHKCPAPCHSGPCQPCPLTGTVSCGCGQSTATFICGREAGVLPPRCRLACPIPRTCRHAALHKPHRCHFGPCRSCTEPCGTVLPCGHVCGSATCHDPRPPPVASFTTPKPPQSGANLSSSRYDNSSPQSPNRASPQPSGSLAVIQSAQRLLEQGPTPCPPCTQPVRVICVGEHSSKDMACCHATAFQCKQLCGRELACGYHSCSKACHAVVGKPQGEECETCIRDCSKPRTCSHPCPLPCHKGPCPLCLEDCRRPCFCGKTTLTLPCHENQRVSTALAAGSNFASGVKGEKEKKGYKGQSSLEELDVSFFLSCGKPCHKPLEYCFHPCRATCHVGQCPQPEECAEEVTVRCSCKRQKQKWKCAQVQNALLQAGKGRVYNTSVPPRLLACDELCNTQSKANKGLDSSTVVVTSLAATSDLPAEVDLRRRGRSINGGRLKEDTCTGDASGLSSQKSLGSKRLSRQERQQLALQRQLEREQQESRRRLLLWLGRASLAAVCLLLAAMLGRGLSSILRTVDEHAAAKWKT